ncbi:hypothetical protein KCU61_g8126, partial [Aureobasidium melanogenum]
MFDDARYIQECVEKIANTGRDIVIMAHSYGGCPATQSLEGLTKTERTTSGKAGGVIRIAYLAGVVPRLEWNTYMTVSASCSSSGRAPQVDIDKYGWMTHRDPQSTADAVFNCLSPESRNSKSGLFGPHAGPAFTDALTHPGYRGIPVSWYLCENDLSVSPEIQRDAIDMIERSWQGTERAGLKVDVTRSQCDHMPMFSANNHLNDWMEHIILAVGSFQVTPVKYLTYVALIRAGLLILVIIAEIKNADP